MVEPVFISQEDIFLRPMTNADIVDGYYNAFNNFSLTKTNSHGSFPVGQRSAEEVLEDMAEKKSIRLMICLNKKETAIGVCSIQNIDFINRHAEIARFIWDEDVRGKGLGTQVLRGLVNHCFLVLNLYKVYLGNASFNTAAIKSARKVGFKQDGVLRNHLFKQGTYHDVILSSLFLEELI